MPEIIIADETKLNLHQKLLKIADAAGALQKTKNGFNYKYVPEEEIQAKVTAGMQKYKVMLYCSLVPGTLKYEKFTYPKYDKKLEKEIPVTEYIVSADTLYTWVNTENPEDKMEVPWALIGQMEDVSMAFGTGTTYCNRYFLMKTLQLATSEDDPDNYRSKQKLAENYEEDKAAKEAAEQSAKELKAKIKEVTAAGVDLIKVGASKEQIRKIVAEQNNGNGNPSSISSLDVCDKVIAAFEAFKETLK